MQLSQNELKDFALRYFGIRTTRAHSVLAKKKARSIQTIIINSATLTDGTLHYSRALTWGTGGENPAAVAHRALSEQSTAIAAALPQASTATARPVTTFSGKVFGSIWHHGDTYTGAWVGVPSAIAHHADMTDTERERLLLECRKLAAHGSSVYVVATSAHTIIPSSYRGSRSSIVGLLIFHPQLHHACEEAVAGIRGTGISIVYASGDSEHVVQTLASASLLAPSHEAPFVWRPGKQLPADAPMYASLDAKTRQKVLQLFPPESTLVVDEPLPAFWRSFATFL